MEELSLIGLERLLEQIQDSLDQVLQNRVIIASNTIEIYTSFERIHVALIQAENYDPHFINSVINITENEHEDSMMETLVRLAQEIDELSMEYDEFM